MTHPGKRRLLVISTNPWASAIAIERGYCIRNREDAIVDGLNLFDEFTSKSAAYRPIDRILEKVSRKYARFVKPVLSGRDITKDIVIDSHDIPPLPGDVSEARRYNYLGAAVGLGALSTTFSVTKLNDSATIEELGQVFKDAWVSAHVSARIGVQIAKMGYDEVTLFNGRLCFSRPIIDILKGSTKVRRFEVGGSWDRWIESTDSIHLPSTLVSLINKHQYDADDAEFFYQERFNRRSGSKVLESFTQHQDIGSIPKELIGKEFIAFFNSSTDEFLTTKDNTNFGEFNSQNDIILEIAKLCRHSSLVPVIRLHPHLIKKPESWKAEYDFAIMQELGVFIIHPDDPCDTYQLIRQAKAVITCGSTVSFEAAYLNIPNAVVGEEPSGLLGASHVINTALELRDFIQAPAVLPDARKAALWYGSFFRRGGKKIDDFVMDKHQSLARIDGRFADPVRALWRSVYRPADSPGSV